MGTEGGWAELPELVEKVLKMIAGYWASRP
jgi:hypothetical protein